MAEERWGSWSSPNARQNHGKEFVPWPLQLQREFGQMHFENRICLFYFSQGLGSVRNMQFSGYAKGLDYLLSDLGDKSQCIIELEGEWEAEVRDEFSYEKLCYL